MDDLSLRVYLENGSDAMRGGWLELPVVPERLDAFMRGVVGVDDGGGYAFDHFAKPREIEQKANGRPVAINFRPGEPVRLFRGVGPERRTLEISNPWDLCRAVKAHNDEYARSRQEAAAMSAEASQARGAAGGADEFDTFGEPADVQAGYLPGAPAVPTTMLDPSSGMGATL